MLWSRCNLPFEFPVDGATLRIRRRFHCPSGINDTTRISLRMTVGKEVTVRLNDAAVNVSSNDSTSTEASIECDVTGQLDSFNCVEVRGVAPNCLNEVTLCIFDD